MNKSSHYVQRAYLEGFCDPSTPGTLWVYDRKLHELALRHTSKVAKIKGYYRILGADGTVSDLEGAALLDRIEGDGMAVIKAADRGEDLGAAERLKLARYVALASSRTPAYESAFVRDVIRRMRTLCRDAGIAAPRDPEQMELEHDRNAVERYAYCTLAPGKRTFSMSRGFHVHQIVDRVRRMSQKLIALGWKLLVAESKVPFVTSDSPCIVILPVKSNMARRYMVDPSEPEVRVLFPISTRVCLLMRGAASERTREPVEADVVREVNGHLFRQCFQYVFSPTPDILSVMPGGATWKDAPPRRAQFPRQLRHLDSPGQHRGAPVLGMRISPPARSAWSRPVVDIEQWDADVPGHSPHLGAPPE